MNNEYGQYLPSSDRYDSTTYRRCGKSGLCLPPISLGLWHNFGNYTEFSRMRDMLCTAFDHGITHFDIANNYGPENGSAERNAGQIIKECFSHHRDELIISTKAGYKMWDGPYGDYGSRKYLISSIDQSLQRLQLPYVDIFYHHRPDNQTPLEETMGALAQIVTSGKALYVGLSNYSGEELRKAEEILNSLHVPFVINQNCYNMLDRTVENNDLLTAVRDLNKGLIIYSPLAQGLLTNRYINGIPENSRVMTDGRFLHKSDVEHYQSTVGKLNELAQTRGQSLAQMAISWLLNKQEVTSVLVGASRSEQILDSLKAVDNTSFTTQEIDYIDELTKTA